MNKVRKSQPVIPPTRGPRKAAVPKTPAAVSAGADDDGLDVGRIAIQLVMKLSRNEAALNQKTQN